MATGKYFKSNAKECLGRKQKNDSDGPKNRLLKRSRTVSDLAAVGLIGHLDMG